MLYRFKGILSGLTFLVLLLNAPVIRAWADAPVPIHLLLDWYPQAEQGGYFCALVKGYYKEAGLDVQISPLGASASSEGQVAMGKFEFSLASSNDVMLARKQGFPLVCVMATMQHDPQCIIVHEDSPVHNFSDLEGHTVAVPPASPGFAYVLKKYHLQNVQEERETVSTAVFIAKPDYMQQAFVTSEPYFAGLKGAKTRCLLYSDAGVDPYRTVFTSDSFLHDHLDLVKKFVAASIKGWKEYLVDPTDTDQEIKRENPAMTQGQIDYSRGILRDHHFINDPSKGEETGQMTAKRWTAEKKVLVDIGLLPPDFDETKAYTLDALPPVDSAPSNAAPAAK